MVADLVDEDVRYKLAQPDVAAIDPLFKDGAAVEKHHWLDRGGVHYRTLCEIDASVEAGELERIVDTHVSQNFLVGEILDTDQDIAGEVAKLAWQLLPRVARVAINVIEGWCEWICHDRVSLAASLLRSTD